MALFFFIVLLSDVKFTINAFLGALSLENFVDKNNIIPLITVSGTLFAYFSIVILSFGDFSRYVENENQLKKGNLTLILNLIIFSFFSLFILSISFVSKSLIFSNGISSKKPLTPAKIETTCSATVNGEY